EMPFRTVKRGDRNIIHTFVNSIVKKCVYDFPVPMSHLIENQNNGQVIIIENEIPQLDYSNANLIHFTKETGVMDYLMV
ncbi:hypothetical protein ACWE42_21720, partial [Sutcliffiella cohnii]